VSRCDLKNGLTSLRQKINPQAKSKIHHQISVYVLMIVDFGRALGTSKVLDVRRRGVPTEAYK